MLFQTAALGGGITGKNGPAVAVSLPPIDSLVQGVMDGVGVPTLLMASGGSPHAQSLRPSQVRAIANADLVFWVGPAMETFLDRPMATLPPARIVTLMDSPEIHLLPSRTSNAHGVKAVAPEFDHDHDHGAYDPHIWLSPENARAVVAVAARRLSAIDPKHSAIYHKNAAALDLRLNALQQDIQAAVRPLRGRAFVVQHDAYHYFEAAFGLQSTAYISTLPERRPSARHIADVIALIKEKKAACLFSEPQFDPAQARAIAQETGVRLAQLDPIGATIKPGKSFYFELMERLKHDFVSCLGRR
ncbi:zinc ABC transporter substrate-binding protein [Varunaivibrio sulfuroxidans]|uniref:High-affinity zinc uptake system protein ZnuA n=1 Tax=Varunaivibrio sulfuroxidans TaxID=1773489 RepID=A0A4R3JF39_9PROT|nr:zinc ABC transporter substrate-binding protein [Varunaivibrio sulfuroxidans]TCS64095.1 zinc transport system substrate-binding protein [Varunaivibrio sulfuroxidans]WES31456.1 zinc ABC transporter substrate-binding protein [Varunaivibrio sulfuroxidans]